MVGDPAWEGPSSLVVVEGDVAEEEPSCPEGGVRASLAFSDQLKTWVEH